MLKASIRDAPQFGGVRIQTHLHRNFYHPVATIGEVKVRKTVNFKVHWFALDMTTWSFGSTCLAAAVKPCFHIILSFLKHRFLEAWCYCETTIARSLVFCFLRQGCHHQKWCTGMSQGACRKARNSWKLVVGQKYFEHWWNGANKLREHNQT